VSERENDPFIDEIAEELRRPVRFDSSFESRVMATIAPAVEARPDERRVTTPWLLRPRIFYVSPLAGLAVAAGLVAIITMSVLRSVPSQDLANVPARDSAPGIGVTPVNYDPSTVDTPVVTAPFTYIAPGARSVAVVGNFNDWDATKNALALCSDSVWTGNIRLAPGRYEYQLVVDGKWIADPNAQHSARDEFGGTNSVLIVSPVPR
jgi:hypothetical protein